MWLSVFFAVALTTASPSPSPSPSSTPSPIRVVAPFATLVLEVAQTEAQRERGLMDRTMLPRHHGMLFIFDADAPVEFWMKNTLIPLDMVFVDGKGTVRTVARNVPATTTNTPDEKIPRRFGTARYVLELPANEAAKDGLKPGARVFGVPPLR